MSEKDKTAEVVIDEKSVFDVKDKKRNIKLRQKILFCTNRALPRSSGMDAYHKSL